MLIQNSGKRPSIVRVLEILKNQFNIQFSQTVIKDINSQGLFNDKLQENQQRNTGQNSQLRFQIPWERPILRKIFQNYIRNEGLWIQSDTESGQIVKSIKGHREKKSIETTFCSFNLKQKDESDL